MKFQSLSTLVISLFFALVFTGTIQAQVRIGVVSSSTGPVSLVGIPQKNTVALLPRKIGDLTVEYVLMDDASDPTATVTAFKRLISEDKVDAIIGPSGSPNAMGVIQFVAEARVPLLATVGTAAVVQPMNAQKKWVFKTTQNDEIIAEALVSHMKSSGVKTAAFIGVNDPFGENWLRVFTAMAKQAGISLTAVERFQRGDHSVLGQTLKLIAAKPDAVLVAAAGGSAVLPHVALADKGFKGQIYQTHGAALRDFLKLGGKKVEGAILAASLLLVLPDIPESHPSKRIAQGYVEAYTKLYGEEPATFGANVYDAGLLLSRAIPIAAKSGAPGSVAFRTALRDALEKTTELVGTQGVFNMTPDDHSGFDQRGRELITVTNGNWSLVR